jgi:hypothetical protein
MIDSFLKTIKLNGVYRQLYNFVKDGEIKTYAEIKSEGDYDLHYRLVDDIISLAHHRALQLGMDPFNHATLTDLIWSIQKAEGYEKCYKTRTTCSEDRCCWMRMCFCEKCAADDY